MDNERLGGNLPEQIPETERVKLNHQLGAKVLANVGFEQRHKDIVESSFDKARSRGEKLSGKNSERRNLAYISRLDGMIGQYGNELERRLWYLSAKKLIIEPEDIQESYWKSQEQILRDNGRGDMEIGPYEKRLLTDKIREQQSESLEPWTSYLSDKDSPYPLWFKLYAWDGMSKMGVFNKEKQRFDVRNKHTVAPYPKLNQAVLSKTYRAVLDAYGISDDPHMDLDGSMTLDDNPGKKVLSSPSGSTVFNDIYSKILLNEKTVLPTPERTEDVHGQWIEYLPGDENALADAAEGTPWCVADPGTGRNYLTYGSYEHDYYDDEDEDEGGARKSRAKFILFHLQDVETGQISQNACASIRLDTYGEVAEVSGLEEGQALEDSLVPIVEEKVLSLPGGEHFLKSFADKKQLIALDRKMNKEEPLSKEEMEFLFEVKRRIVTLDTYNERDPRIEELQDYYMDDARQQGVVNDAQIEFLQKVGDGYVKPEDFIRYYEEGVDINLLLESTRGNLTDENAGIALNAKEVNLPLLMDKMSPEAVIGNFGVLTEKSAEIDIDKIVSRLSSEYVSEHVADLIAKNVSPQKLVPILDAKSAAKNFVLLIKSGVSPDDIIPRLSMATVAKNAKVMIEKYHASQSAIVGALSDEAIRKNFNYLCNKQGLDINLLVPRLDSQTICRNMHYLAKNGASGEAIASVLPTLKVIDSYDELTGMGVKFDLDKIAKELDPNDAIWRLDEMDRIGIKYDINEIIRNANPQDVDTLADTLVGQHRASRSVIAEILGNTYF